MSRTTLYFAYDASLDPDRIIAVCPGATFRFSAHYPETRLDFATGESGEAQPTLVRDPAHTVWGGVFEIPDPEVESLIAEFGAGRGIDFEHKAVDREGNKYDCLTFVSSEPGGAARPSPEYVDAMVRGARHWDLPAGWVMGLADLVDDPLFT